VSSFWRQNHGNAQSLFKQRCSRNLVFGARDPGRKTFFLKDCVLKKTLIFKIFPCGAKIVPCGASVNAEQFYTKGARAVSLCDAVFLADFCPRGGKFFLKKVF
jgi:hypothetical protein